MPFIDVRTSCPVSVAQEEGLKAQLGKAIALIPGKSEGSLMVYGASAKEAYKKFSDAVVPQLEQVLGCRHVYLKFEEVPNWFWN